MWLLCFAPLAWIPGVANMWIFGKALLVALAVLAGALAGVRGGLPRAYYALGLLGLAVFVLAAIHGGTPLASLMGRYPRYEGLPMLALYVAALWLGTTMGRGSAGRAALPDALASSMLALGAATVAELSGHNPLRLSAVRSGALLGNATDQGLVAMMAVLVLAGPAWRRRDPLLACGALAAAFVLAVSGSRAAVIGLVAAGIALAIARGRRTAAAAGIASAVVLGVALLIPMSRARFTDGASVHARLEIWSMSRDLFAMHPILGVGPSRYIDEVGAVETVAWAHGAGRGNAILDAPHSWVLTFAMDAGVVGILLAAVLVLVVVRTSWRAARATGIDDLTPGLYAAVIGYGVGLLVNFTIVGSTAPAAFLLGVLLAPAAAPMRRGLARAAVAAGAVLVLGAASATAAEVEFTRGLRAAQHGDLSAGVSRIALARALRPGDVDLDNLAADVLAGSTAPGAHQAVEAWAARSQRATPGTYRSLMAAAVSDITVSDDATALARLDGVVAAYPRRALPLVQRARAELDLGWGTAARRDLVAARRLAPLDAAIPALLARTAR